MLRPRSKLEFKPSEPVLINRNIPEYKNLACIYTVRDLRDQATNEIIGSSIVPIFGAGAAAPSWEENLAGRCIRMDGGDECKLINTPVSAGDTAFSFIFIGSVANTSNEYALVSCAEDGSGFDHSTLMANNSSNVGGISFWRTGVGIAHTTAAFPVDGVFSCGVSCSATNQQVYLNGVADGSNSGSPTSSTYGRHAVGGIYRGGSGGTPISRLVGDINLVLVFSAAELTAKDQKWYADNWIDGIFGEPEEYYYVEAVAGGNIIPILRRRIEGH